jgi:hypothetical protein
VASLRPEYPDSPSSGSHKVGLPPAPTYRRLQYFCLKNTVFTPYIFMRIKGNIKLRAG